MRGFYFLFFLLNYVLFRDNLSTALLESRDSWVQEDYAEVGVGRGWRSKQKNYISQNPVGEDEHRIFIFIFAINNQ